jgi:hypothetical protein
MCGGGNINFPDPHEVGGAQFAWNNLNQYTPYGSVEYSAPELDANGNPTGPGSMTQTLDPNLLALQEAMLGIRGNALNRIGGMFGEGGAFGAGNFSFNSPPGPGTQPYHPYMFGNPWGDAGPGGGSGATTDPIQGNHKGMGNKRGATARPGGSGRATPDGLMPWQYGQAQDPGMTPPINDVPPHNYRGSTMFPDEGGLNSLFQSDNAPALGYNFNMGSLPGLLGAGDLQGERERITQAKFDRLSGLLDPVFERKNSMLQERMANRGMPVGAEEYGILQGELNDQESDAYLNAALDADITGGDELSRLAGLSAQQRAQRFGEQGTQLGVRNQARQQAFGETMGVRDSLLRSMLGLGQLGIQQGQFGLQRQGQEFGQLAGLLGLTQAPGAGGDLGQFYGPSPIDMMNAYGMNMGGQQFNAGNQITGAGLMSGLFGLGGAALGSGMFGPGR